MLTWLQEMITASALMGALLRVMHPELYFAGITGMRALVDQPELVKEDRDVLRILQAWSSPFSAYSIISNRTTPPHRDNHSSPPWYDLLVPVGTYSGGEIKFPGLGLTLGYRPGTMVALCGKLIRHEVPEVIGNRVCLAHYMRERVLERLTTEPAGWMTLDIHGD